MHGGCGHRQRGKQLFILSPLFRKVYVGIHTRYIVGEIRWEEPKSMKEVEF